MPKVFISGTSRDLSSYREVVTQWARDNGHEPIVQDEFPVQSDCDTIVQMLRGKLDPCDAVIHLAGLFYGFEPTNRPDCDGRRSYTQLEYELGKELRRQVFRFIARPDYVADGAFTQSDEHADLQRLHRQRLMQGSEPWSATSRTTGNELYYEFSNHEELRGLLDGIVIRPTLAKPQNLPLVGSLFKGRDDFIDQLRSPLVNKPTHIAAVTAKQAIHGLGGVGKTRVAVEYANRFSHEYTALLFVTAAKPGDLETNLANLCGAMVLDLPEKLAMERDVQAAAALRWLREHSGWFLIVDNVDTPEAAEEVEHLLQQLDSGHVVVTSRLSQWGHAFEVLSLDIISVLAAQEFLLDRTAGRRKSTDNDESDAMALASDLGRLPLALEQAGAFIVEDGCSFSEYRILWKARDDEVLTWHDQRSMKYPRSVATTWLASFERLCPDAQGLLRILSWLSSEPIPLTMLEKLASETGELPIDVRKARRDLARYSFVKWTDESHQSFDIHRLVQEITKYRLTEVERKHWILRALQMVNEFIPTKPTCFDVRSWPEIYLPGESHFAAIVNAADALEIAAPTTRLMGCLAGYLKSRAAYTEAEPLMRRAMVIDEQYYGTDHPSVAIRLNNLTQLLQDTNRLSEAEPLMRRALAIDEQYYGTEHPKVAVELNNLASLLQAMNRLSEAEPLMRRVVSILEQSYGENHPDVTTAMSNLAQILQATNRMLEAESLMRRSLAIDEQSYGPEHPSVAIRLNNLAVLLQATNRLSEAEPLMARVVTTFETAYGENHPNVATALNNLAQLLQATNRLSEAEPLMRRALSIDEQSYGNEHPNVARDMNNLAQLFQATNRLSEAEPLMRRALAIDEQSYGNEHPDVARDLNNLAQLLQATNRLTEAEQFSRRHVLIFIAFGKATGHEHPRMRAAIANYLNLLQEMGLSEDEANAKVLSQLRGKS